MGLRGFVVEINMENAAFDDEPMTEVARILRDLATKCETGACRDNGDLRDINGNTVGVYNVNARLTED